MTKILSASLAKDDPAAYQAIRQFVEENNLKVRSGRYPAMPERREEYIGS